jgi:hypothetical protein
VATVGIDAGVCGYSATVRAARGPGHTVQVSIESECAHAACPVPSGLLKAIEVAAGLALAKDVTMQVSTGD